MTEPLATALLLTIVGSLLAVSILFTRASERIGVPLALLFLGIGLAMSPFLPNLTPEKSSGLAFRLGVTALTLILFDGGLNTPMSAVRRAIKPAGLLATVGVAGTALLVASAARMLGFEWPTALLLGAIVSSTDAAAVFAVLRGSRIQLKRRVGVTLEVESGLNDPMAVILTTLLIQNLVDPGSVTLWLAPVYVLRDLAIGTAGGVVVGLGWRALLTRMRLPAGGLYPVLTVAIAALAFGLPTLLHGSGFLAVYIAAVIIGDGALPFRTSLQRVHDAMAWLSQIVMFLFLGLLVELDRLKSVAFEGLVLALFLAFIARPLVVPLCLAWFRYTRRDVLYVGWVGLRGAVPIILATMPLLARAPGAAMIFHTVFFIVVVGALVPGGTVAWVTRRLGLVSNDPPPSRAVLEIESEGPLRGELLSFYIDELLPVTGVPLSDMPFPSGAAVTIIVRGRDLIAPKGDSTLLPGDHAYVLCRREDRAMIHLMFGRPE